MKKILVAAILLAVAPGTLADEAGDREAVIQVVVDFFEALTARDVERMSALLTSDGMIYGYREGADGTSIIRRSNNEYMEGLKTGEGHLVERFWDPEVMIYERLATVYTPYDFHIDGQFSHCGVNNFSMLRTDEGWVITGVVFSIAAEGCDESPLGPFPDDKPQ